MTRPLHTNKNEKILTNNYVPIKPRFYNENG